MTGQEVSIGDTIPTLTGAARHPAQLGHGPGDTWWHGDIKPSDWNIPKRARDLRVVQGSATPRETEAQTQLEHRCSCGERVSLLGTHLLEVVKGSQDDVVATSDQADSGQQLQHQSLGPAETEV